MTPVAGVYEREIADRKSNPSVRHSADHAVMVSAQIFKTNVCATTITYGALELRVDVIYSQRRSLSERKSFLTTY